MNSNRIYAYLFSILLAISLPACNNSGGGSSSSQNSAAVATDSNIGTLPNGSVVYSSRDKYEIPANAVTTGIIQAIDNYADNGHFIFNVHPTHNIDKPDILPIVKISSALCEAKSNSANVCNLKIIGNNASAGHYMITPEFVGNDGKVKKLNHIALEITPKSNLSQNGTLAISLTKLSKQDNYVTATISLNNSVNINNLLVSVSNNSEKKSTCILSTVNNDCQIKINKGSLINNKSSTPENFISATAANYATTLKSITANGHIVLSLPFSGIITNENVPATITLYGANGINNLKVTLSSSDSRIVGAVNGTSCIIANSNNNNSCQITLVGGKNPSIKEAEIIAAAAGYTPSSHHLGVSQILVGTNNGVYSADGKLFSVPHNPGPYIPTNPNSSGIITMNGHLYIASYNLSSGNGATIDDYNISTQNVTSNALNSSGLGNSEFEAISERNGIVYTATSNNYITTIQSYSKGTWTTLHSDQQNYSLFTKAIAVKNENNQLIIYELYTNGYLAKYSKPADDLSQPPAAKVVANGVTSIAMTNSGILIYSDVNGYVHSYNDTSQNNLYGEIAGGAQVPGNMVRYIALDNQDSVYAITSGGFLVKSFIGKYNWEFLNNIVIPDHGINAKMVFDLSTNNLFVVDGSNNLFEILDNSGSLRKVHKMWYHPNVEQILFDDKGKLFVGTSSGRILRHEAGVWDDINFPASSGALFLDIHNNLIAGGLDSNSNYHLAKYNNDNRTWNNLLSSSEWYSYLSDVGVSALGITISGKLLVFPSDYNYGYVIKHTDELRQQTKLPGLPGVLVNSSNNLYDYPNGLVVTKGNGFTVLNSLTDNSNTVCGSYSFVCYYSLSSAAAEGIMNTPYTLNEYVNGGASFLDYDIGNDRFNVLYKGSTDYYHVARSVASGSGIKNIGKEPTNLSRSPIIGHDVEGNVYVADTNNNMYRVTDDNVYQIGSDFGGNTINQNSIAIWPYVHYSLAF